MNGTMVKNIGLGNPGQASGGARHSEGLQPEEEQKPEELQPEGFQPKDQQPKDFGPEDLRLEELLAQVEHCIGQLEDPQISLEDSFRYYEEGIRKLKICSSKVAQIEQKMMVINSRGELEDF